MALGATGRPPAPSVTCYETHHHDGRYLSAYERSKAVAHEVALRWRKQGLPLVIAMPSPVVGANDHSVFGYFLRLILLGAMPPIAFGGDMVAAWVDVDALTEGICLAAEHASMGEDYLFCGERCQLRDLFDIWGQETSRMTPRIYLPRPLMRPLMGLFEPVERAFGLPAFFSRETVDVTRGHWDYSSAKAKRDLGWDHPGLHEMWPPIVRREKKLMDRRTGFLSKLSHIPVIPSTTALIGLPRSLMTTRNIAWQFQTTENRKPARTCASLPS